MPMDIQNVPIIAEAHGSKILRVEGNDYLPPCAVTQEFLNPSDKHMY